MTEHTQIKQNKYSTLTNLN